MRTTFPGIALDEIAQVEDLFNCNIWVYELVEEEQKVKAERCQRGRSAFIDDEAGEGDDDDEAEDDAADDRRKKVQTALLLRAPTLESQQIDGRLKVYVNRYQDHISLITNINQYGQSFKCKCGFSAKRRWCLEDHIRTCTGEKKQKLIFPGTGMAVSKSIWQQLDQIGIQTTGPVHYPYFACWDFEARVCHADETNFTPLPAASNQLPQHALANNGVYTIPNPNLSKLDEYCATIASQQPCIFDIAVTVVYRLTKDTVDSQRRRSIITATNIIHNLEEYQQVFPAGRILNAIETSQLISPRVLIDAIEYKVARKQLLFTSSLKPVSFAVNSNVPVFDTPTYDVCEEDDEDAVRQLLASFNAKLTTISDEAYTTLRRQHDGAFDSLRQVFVLM